MRLLIVVPGGVHPSGEVEVIPVLLNLFKALSRDHEICIVALYQHRQLTEYRLCNCQVISLAMVTTANMVKSWRIVLKRLRHYGFQPDLVHSFWLGKPTLLGAMLSKTYRVPLCATVGGGEMVDMPEIGYGGSQRLISRWFNALGLKLADVTTCGSGFVQVLSKQRWGIEPDLVPLGLDIAVWPIKAPENNPTKAWRLVHIASINAVKDPWLLLDTVDCLKQAGFDFQLDWIGQDTLDGEIQQKAHTMGLAEHIHFHGFKTQVQLKQMLTGQHFVIQTSRHESQGVAMAEACTQGLCPVGTDVGWLHDLGIGLAASHQALAAQIMALAADFNARKAQTQAAQNWIVANDLALTSERFTRFYLAPLPPQPQCRTKTR